MCEYECMSFECVYQRELCECMSVVCVCELCVLV